MPVDPSPFERIRYSFQAEEARWRWCQAFVERVLPEIEDDETGLWKMTLRQMHNTANDMTFLCMMGLLEDALVLAIETHAPGHTGLPTLNDKLKFAEDINILKNARELHALKRLRNQFLHSFHDVSDMEADVALDVVAAELDHLGFGPIPRLARLFGPDGWDPSGPD